MTVQELIEKLKEYPPDVLVMVPGFDESGLDDLEYFELRKVILNINTGWHCGRHDWSSADNPEAVDALIIN